MCYWCLDSLLPLNCLHLVVFWFINCFQISLLVSCALLPAFICCQLLLLCLTFSLRRIWKSSTIFVAWADFQLIMPVGFLFILKLTLLPQECQTVANFSNCNLRRSHWKWKLNFFFDCCYYWDPTSLSWDEGGLMLVAKVNKWLYHVPVCMYSSSGECHVIVGVSLNSL